MDSLLELQDFLNRLRADTSSTAALVMLLALSAVGYAMAALLFRRFIFRFQPQSTGEVENEYTEYRDGATGPVMRDK